MWSRYSVIWILLVSLLVIRPKLIAAQERSAVLITSQSGALSGLIEPLDEFGAAIADMRDLDGDGNPDFIVGAPRTHRYGFDRGAAYVLFLRPDLSVRRVQILSDDPLITDLIEDGSQFGRALLNLGDLDADGSTEVAVGLPGADLRKGAVWILSMLSSGQVEAVSVVDSGRFPGLGLADNARFGSSLAKLEDLNGDGMPEIAVGGPSAGKGAVWILSLSLTSSGIGIDTLKIQSAEPRFSDRVLPSRSLRFGSAVAPITDLDGDNIFDLTIGLPNDDFGGPVAGSVLVGGMNEQGILGPQRVLFVGNEQGSQLGSSLAGFDDVDGNSVRELLVGAPRKSLGGPRRGEVYRLFLGVGGQLLMVDSLSTSIDVGLGDGGLFGTAIDVMSDLDGNGLSEVLVGAPGYEQSSGSVWILFSARPSLSSIKDVVVTPSATPSDDESIGIQAHVTDQAGVRRVWLDLRRGGESSWLTTQMSAGAGDTYSQEIPGEFLSERGVEFAVRARGDTGLDSRVPRSGYLSIPLFLTNGIGLTVRHGLTASSYRLISFPLDLQDKSARRNLTDDLGEPIASEWRVLRYSDRKLSDLRDGDFNIEPGRSYWMIAGENDRAIRSGAGTTIRSDRAFSIALEPGWNLFGSPFAFELPREALRFAAQSVDIRAFENGIWTDDVQVIRPYVGYAVWNSRSGPDFLFVDPTIRTPSNNSLRQADVDETRIRRNDLLHELSPAGPNSLAETTIPGVPGPIVHTYPNPTQGAVTVSYSVLQASDIRIETYDVLGRKVAAILDREHHPAGQFSISWGRGAGHEELTPGIYVIRMSTGGRILDTRTVTVVR